MLKILTSLPVEMTLGDALAEAKRLKKVDANTKNYINVKNYRQEHREEVNRKKREVRAEKKLKLQAVI